MIVYDLQCDADHRFEGWFGSSADYDEQRARGLVDCPICGSTDISKAPMAPAVSAKSNKSVEPRSAPPTETEQAMQSAPAGVPAPTNAQPVSNMPMPKEMQEALSKLAKAQEKALSKSTWVGKDFAEQSREMHYGERDETAIHGQASVEEAQSLIDEGVPIAPLPFPLTPPDELN